MTSSPLLSCFFGSLGRCRPREGVASASAVEGYWRSTRPICSVPALRKHAGMVIVVCRAARSKDPRAGARRHSASIHQMPIDRDGLEADRYEAQDVRRERVLVLDDLAVIRSVCACEQCLCLAYFMGETAASAHHFRRFWTRWVQERNRKTERSGRALSQDPLSTPL